MRTRFWKSVLPLALMLFATGRVVADDREALQGKWETKKVNEAGISFKQTVEIKKDKFIFQVLDLEDHVALYAEGATKLEKLGPFNSVKFLDIRGGSSSANLDEVDDEFTVVYTLDGDRWTLASNFDKQRDQKPSLDVYQRVKATAAGGTLIIDSIAMADTPQLAVWYLCFEANAGDSKGRHYQTDKGYEQKRVTIPMNLSLANVSAGQKCSFKLQLDDIDADTCGDEPDNRSTGEFTISKEGSATFKPESNWQFTIHWHMKQDE
jgi:hypothetical protein